MDLKALKAEMPYQWKVQGAKSWGCDCVAYVTARQVMDRLDDVCGPENWQDEYREVAGKVYCSLSIFIDGRWVTKSDCGSESNFEREKGQASDAFKRAAVKWGIGRFLYELDIVKLKSVEGNGGKYFPADAQGRRIYNVDAHIKAIQKPKQALSEPMAKPSTKEAITEACKKAGVDRGMLKSLLADMGVNWKTLTEKQAQGVIAEIKSL